MSGFAFEEPAAAGREVAPPGAATGRVHHTRAMVEHFRKTRPWVLFLAILGLVGAGFSLLFAVGFVVSMALGAGSSGLGGTGEILIIVFGALFYGLIGAFNAFFSILLLRYSRAIGEVLAWGRTEDVERALDAQRVFFKVFGIATVAGIALSILGIFAAMVVGIALAAGGMS